MADSGGQSGHDSRGADDRPLGEPLLDAARAAELLSVRPSWVYESVRSGRMPHVKLGRHIRFLRSDLEAWLLDQRNWGRRS
jgi:excisionase family DNA binding protein